MKVLRIDNQTEDRTVFNNLEELRLALRDFHSLEWNENDDNNKSIDSLSLQDLCDHGDWSYEIISDEDAKQYEVA